MIAELLLAGLGGSVGYVAFWLRKHVVRAESAADSAWLAAAVQLGDRAPLRRSIRYRARSGYEVILTERRGQSFPFLTCDVQQLPGLDRVTLGAEPSRWSRTHVLTHAELLRANQVHSTPAWVATAFLDEATKALLVPTFEALQVHDGRFRVRGELRREQSELLAFARTAELLADRWLELVAGCMGLAHELGFEANEAALSLGRPCAYANAFRHGISWTLQLVPDDAQCEIVLVSNRAELRFDWTTPAAEIGAAFAAKESELTGDGAYR